MTNLRLTTRNCLRDINSLSPKLRHGEKGRDLYDPEGEEWCIAEVPRRKTPDVCENNTSHATLSVDVSGSDQTAKGLHREAVDRAEGAILGPPKEYV